MQGWSEFGNFGVRAQRRPCEQSAEVQHFELSKCETECKDCELQIIQDNDENLGVCKNCRLGMRNSGRTKSGKRKQTSDLDEVQIGRLLERKRISRQPAQHNFKNVAFTLAEVLIALVVIGIIAAITLTTVMPNIQERANSQRQANIVYKVTQATNLMKSNGALSEGFESTDKFVDELQKYLKIMKRCDSDHIADCWPTKKITDSEGNEYEVSKAKTRGDLGFKDDYKDNKNVGIVLADGASLIMTYNPANGGINPGDALTAQTTILPGGGRYQTFLDYTSNTTGGLAFVMDVNGNKGPNKDVVYLSDDKKQKKYFDIRSLNGATFSKGFTWELITSPSNFDCTKNKTNTFCAQKNDAGNSYTSYTADRWAGASNDCAAKGGHLPTYQELKNICNSPTERAKYGLTGITVSLWSSQLYPDSGGSNKVWCVEFSSSCIVNSNLRRYTFPQALCLGD